MTNNEIINMFKDVDFITWICNNSECFKVKVSKKTGIISIGNKYNWKENASISYDPLNEGTIFKLFNSYDNTTLIIRLLEKTFSLLCCKYNENNNENHNIKLLSIENKIKLNFINKYYMQEKELDNRIGLMNKWNRLKTFKEQIDFLIKYNNIFTVYLDNDGEYICFNDVEDNDMYNFNGFYIDEWFGNKDGVIKLFEYLGINVKEV